MARNRRGHNLRETDLRVPREVIRRALENRRELLSMNFEPLGAAETRPQNSIADLELRSVVCVPLVRIRAGQSNATSVLVDRQRDGRRAVHGFARDGGGPGRRQSGTAADPGHRGVHRAGKCTPAAGGAVQASDGRGTAAGAHHPAEPASGKSAGRGMAAGERQQPGIARGGRRLLRRDARSVRTAGARSWRTFPARA